jgi:hypothetical protein
VGLDRRKKRFILIIAVAAVVAAAWGYLLVVQPLLYTSGGGSDGASHPDLDCAVTAVKAEMTDGAGSADYTFTARENSGEVKVTPGAHKSIIVEVNDDARWLVFYNESSDYTVLCLNESAETLTPGCELYIVSEKQPAEESAPTGELTDEEKREVWDAAMEYQRSIKYNDPNRLQKLTETEGVIAERYRLREEDVKAVLAEGRREDWPKPE